MKQTTKLTDNALNSADHDEEEVIFDSRDYDVDAEGLSPLFDYDYCKLLSNIKAKFTPSVLIGTVGVWSGTHKGFNYYLGFAELKQAIAEYDDLIVRQKGERLYFTLLHHDGRHNLELRRLTAYGAEHDDKLNADLYELDDIFEFIEKNTEPFGKIFVVE